MAFRKSALALAFTFLSISKGKDVGSIFSGGNLKPRSKFTDMRSYQHAVKKAPWLFVATRRLGEAVTATKIRIINEDTDEEVTDRFNPVWQVFHQKANRRQFSVHFLEQLVWHLVPTGNAFIWMKDRDSKGIPLEIWLLQPHLVSIVPDDKNIVSEYLFDTGGGKKEHIPAADIVHIRMPHPFDNFWGMGVVEANERIWSTGIAEDQWRWLFFENGGDVGMIFETDGELTDDAYRRLQQQIQDKYEGVDNAHRTFIAEGGLKLNKSAGTNPKEADFAATSKNTRDTELAMTGLFPLQAGLTENSNRATAWVQRTEFQKWTVNPLWRRLLPYLTQVAKNFGPYRVEVDDAVVEDNVEDADISMKYFSIAAITPNEIRTRFLGLKQIKNQPAMDQFYLPLNFLPISEAAGQPPPPQDPPPAEDPDPEPEADDDEPTEDQAPRSAIILPAAQKATAVQRRLLRLYIQRRFMRERQMRPRVRSYFDGQADRAVEQFLSIAGERSFTGKVNRQELPNIENILDLAFEGDIWKNLTANFFTSTMAQEFALQAEIFDYTPSAAFEVGTPAFELKMSQLAKRVKNVNKTTRVRLAKVVGDGLQRGLSPSVIASGDPDTGYLGIRGTFKRFKAGRAQLIARSESAAVMDKANVEVYKGLGVARADVVGCEDQVKMPGQKWGCSSRDIPIREAEKINFHPNHTGAVVPVIASIGRDVLALDRAGVLTRLERSTIFPNVRA